MRISAGKALKAAGISDIEDLFDSEVPACCSEGCMVEPDGYCPHDNPSVLLELELI